MQNFSLHKIHRCPECGEHGLFVKNITVTHVVKKKAAEGLTDADYHLCRNPVCNVGYYNTDIDSTIMKDDFKRPIWLKEGSDPVVACYCTNIKESDIIKTVIETELTELQPVMIYLHGSIGKKCQFTNPTGQCCTAFFKETIQKGLEIKKVLAEYGDLKINSKKVDDEVFKKVAEYQLKK